MFKEGTGRGSTYDFKQYELFRALCIDLAFCIKLTLTDDKFMTYSGINPSQTLVPRELRDSLPFLGSIDPYKIIYRWYRRSLLSMV